MVYAALVCQSCVRVVLCCLALIVSSVVRVECRFRTPNARVEHAPVSLWFELSANFAFRARRASFAT